jgi:hypothetical protein
VGGKGLISRLHNILISLQPSCRTFESLHSISISLAADFTRWSQTRDALTRIAAIVRHVPDQLTVPVPPSQLRALKVRWMLMRVKAGPDMISNPGACIKEAVNLYAHSTC